MPNDDCELSAKSERSGMSRCPSAGTPGPACHVGLAYPPAHCELAGSWLAVVVGVVQVLTPPAPPIGATKNHSVPNSLKNAVPFPAFCKLPELHADAALGNP